jgi:hypothetical protein
MIQWRDSEYQSEWGYVDGKHVHTVRKHRLPGRYVLLSEWSRPILGYSTDELKARAEALTPSGADQEGAGLIQTPTIGNLGGCGRRGLGEQQ